MPEGKSSRLLLSQWDGIYLLFSSIVGLWQVWCLNYGRNSILLALLMGLPFALASYGHAKLLNIAGVVDEHPNWRVLVLWAGMPLSLVAFSLTVLVETRIMTSFGRGADNLPFYDLRLLIGEGVGSIVWAVCLLTWSALLSMRRLRAVSAVLFAGVLFAYGLANLILRGYRKDISIALTSEVTTLASAAILVFMKRRAACCFFVPAETSGQE